MLPKQNQHVSLLGRCSQPDQEEEKGALSGADVWWEAQESRSTERSRCHLDIHSTDSNPASPSLDTLLLAGHGEHHTKRKHVYPVQITSPARLLLLGPVHLLLIKQMA